MREKKVMAPFLEKKSMYTWYSVMTEKQMMGVTSSFLKMGGGWNVSDLCTPFSHTSFLSRGWGLVGLASFTIGFFYFPLTSGLQVHVAVTGRLGHEYDHGDQGEHEGQHEDENLLPPRLGASKTSDQKSFGILVF